MKTLEESVVMSLDGQDEALYPFMPYILQDVWEFGADPESVISLIRKNFHHPAGLRLLDLGCGKGAVSIKAAGQLGCSCFGIDAMPEFIEAALQKAKEFRVEHLCTFETGDIREKVKYLSGFDIIILGAIGPVFGDYYSTLTTLSGCLVQNGAIIIDDGYIENFIEYSHPLIQKRETILEQIGKAGMKLVDEDIIGKDRIRDMDELIFGHLSKRCFELIEKHPDKKDLFINYMNKQVEENDVLENKVICSTLFIARKELM